MSALCWERTSRVPRKSLVGAVAVFDIQQVELLNKSNIAGKLSASVCDVPRSGPGRILSPGSNWQRPQHLQGPGSALMWF